MTSKSIPPPPPLTSSTPPPIDFGDDVDEDEFEDDIYGDDQSYDHDPITTTTATIGIPTTFQIGDDEGKPSMTKGELLQNIYLYYYCSSRTG